MRHNTLHSVTGLLALTICAGLASAQPVATSSYLVEHNFDFQPAGDVVDVRGADFRHAWVWLSNNMRSWGVEAQSQNPDFDPFGTESWAMGAGGFPSVFNSGLSGIPVQCNYNVFNIPPSGINWAGCITVPIGSNFAQACTSFFVWPYGTVAPFRIQGRITSHGSANVRGGSAYAYSSAAIFVRGGVQLANGRIQWNSNIMSDIIGGGASANNIAVRDPVHFVAENLDTGDVVEASLFDYFIDAEEGGIVQWTGDVFETDAPELEFVLDMPSAFVAPGQAGSITLIISNGIVVFSDDTGVFDGLLPPDGTAVPISFPLPNTIDLDYNLGLDDDHLWDVTVDLSGGGGASAYGQGAGCPADLNGDGVLDFFDIAQFLEMFSSEDPEADFNGDGIFDFFDVLGYLEAFAAGCDG